MYSDRFFERHPGYKQQHCDTTRTLDAPMTGGCWGMMKNPAVVIPIPEVTVALTHALDFVADEPVAEIKTFKL
jgi:hypothetical protein